MLENVEATGGKPRREKGQLVRSKHHLEALFEQAGLRIAHHPREVQLHPEYAPVVIWAL